MVTAIITEDFPPAKSREGAWARQLADGLYNAGGQVVVLCLSQGTRQEQVDGQASYPVIRMQSRLWQRLQTVYLFYYTFRLRLKYKEGVVIASRRYLARSAVFFAKRFRVIICDRHRDFEGVYNKRKAGQIHKLYQKAGTAAVVSSYLKSRLEAARIPARDIRVIPDGVDTRRFMPREKPATLLKRHKLEKGRIILSVGDILEQRGFDTVIKALPAVVADIPRAHYLIVGKGPHQRSLVRLTSQLGMDDHVSFCGYVEDRELAGYYNLCDVFAFPCREIPHHHEAEALGLALLEAGASGKPVIAGKSGGVEEVVIDGETGILINPDDADTLSGALVLLLTDRNLATGLGTKARQRIEQLFSWQRYMDSMLALISEQEAA